MTLNIRNVQTLAAVTMAAVCSLLIVLIWNFFAINDQISEAGRQRYQSYLLADELRQSSDDLTRLGRTYVITGDVVFKNQFMAILDIRNGVKPRPEAYSRIYWDFVSAGQLKPRKDGASVPLLDLMRDAGFTQAELAKLAEAKANSDGLVNLEVEAMNLVESKDKEGKPLLAPDFARAAQLLHSPAYHAFKSSIMKPIDEFFVLLDERTLAALTQAEHKASVYRMLIFGMLAIMAAGLVAFGLYMRRNVVAPIYRLANRMTHLAKGDVASPVPGVAARTEIGDMARCVADFATGLTEKDALQTQAAQAADERARMLDSRATIANALQDDMQQMASVLAGFANELTQASQGLGQTASHSAQRVRAALDSANLTSDSAGAIASFTEQLSHTAQQIAAQVSKAEASNAAAGQEAQNSERDIRLLSEAASKIGQIVETISSIASQTSLLALNATIEAARAGEAGRGFAVVATEVKALASQTASATQSISAMVSEIQDATQRAVGSIGSITSTIGNMRAISAEISVSVSDQQAGTVEVVNDTRRAAENAEKVKQHIADVDRVTADTLGAADKIGALASDLAARTRDMKSRVDAFVGELKAA
jgi:methyl-accepting chemotaxis protein